MRLLLAMLAGLGLAGCFEERLRDGHAAEGVHPAGILDRASPDFHVRVLEQLDWDFALCASCHGADFAGGKAEKSCVRCHADGPTACVTCHGGGTNQGAAPGGAHPAHGADEAPSEAACGGCHAVPARWDDDGHILRQGARDPAPAEVILSGLATATIDPVGRKGAPAYDAATGRCDNVYCHGAALVGGGAALTTPRWQGGPSQAGCGTCHGKPPSNHAYAAACATCHPPGAPHVDGVIQVGRDASCSGCHGDARSAAPPVDLAGNVFTSSITVGAHRSHLEASHHLSAPVACAACHLVPATVLSAGHLDSPAPAEVVAAAGWDRASGTCRNACHGASTPRWTHVGEDEVACGTCHGVPPADDAHDPGLTIRDCVTCHPATVDGFGNILRAGPPGAETSEHIDGDVDL